MKAFKNFITNLINYFINQNNANRNIVKSKWFIEYYEEQERDEIFEKTENAIDCGTRSATKEMLDFGSEISRNLTIRQKTRHDFFVGNALRHDGVIFNLNRKNISLTDIII